MSRGSRIIYSAMKSPQILELSGIGDPKILRKINVPLKVSLPGVGANVQDHVMVGVSFGAIPSVSSKS